MFEVGTVLIINACRVPRRGSLQQLGVCDHSMRCLVRQFQGGGGRNGPTAKPLPGTPKITAL